MEINELFLKTLFCCSACDGDIATEEIELVKKFTKEVDLFKDMSVEETLNTYVNEINKQGKAFLRQYLNELANSELTSEEQVTLVEIAIRMIEADGVIQYSEVKFFKKIRNLLSVSNDVILTNLPDSEDYLLPDTSVEDKEFEDVGNFEPISFVN